MQALKPGKGKSFAISQYPKSILVSFRLQMDENMMQELTMCFMLRLLQFAMSVGS